jgi:mRNA interferase MazF
VIISPDEMNRPLRTVIVAPMTSTTRGYPSRIATTFQGKEGEIVLDQIRTVDKQRLIRRLGVIDRPVQESVLSRLAEMFAR